jgi:excisionase family DNA binding protein
MAQSETVRVAHADVVPDLINIDELSRRLGVAKGTLYNWVYLKRIPYIKAGRCLRFEPQNVYATLRHCPKIEEAGKR